MNDLLVKKAGEYLNQLCVKIGDRSVGSSGNISATEYFKNKVSHFGWEIEEDELNVIDWEEGAAVMAAGNEQFAVKGSPYSAGCSVNAELAVVSNIDELERFEITGRAVLLCGDLAREQLMPKNFVFYNPEHHRKIISLLEEKNPAVIICATGRNSALAGGAYPFPLIEDGDFDIPSVFMTDVEGERLAALNNSEVTVNSTSRRIAARAYNITAKKSGIAAKRIILSAHIDAKKGTPGAIDNGTGVTVLMLLAELLKDYAGKYTIELAPFNGEDYYAVPGQMSFIGKNDGRFGNIMLNINIDGAGYHEGKTAISFYGVPEDICGIVTKIIQSDGNAAQGPQWPQGDHSIFVQYGVPAIAVSSMWFTENMDNQDITHTEKDNLGIVDLEKTVDAAQLIAEIINRIDYI